MGQPESDKSQVPTTRRVGPGWFNPLLWWILAATAGMVLGWGLFYSPGGIYGGILVGLAQWLVLARWVDGADSWVLATAAGWAVFHVVFWFLLWLLPWSAVGLIRGTAIALSQWLVLRRWVRRAAWWVLAGVVGWTLAWMAFEVVDEIVFRRASDSGADLCLVHLLSVLAGGFVGGFVLALVTGVTLVLLFATAGHSPAEAPLSQETTSTEGSEPRGQAYLRALPGKPGKQKQ